MLLNHEITDDINWEYKSFKEKITEYTIWLFAIMLFIYCWRLISRETIWMFVADAPQQLISMVQRMFPPNWEYASNLWQPLWETINIATLGTIGAISISFFIAFFAARNTTPHPIFRKISLFIIVTSRSINALIWAIILVTIIGPGVLSGVIAIALRSIGFISKLFYEAIEEINSITVEAINATGAKKILVILFAIIPQVLPSFLGTSIYRWDINIRESTVVGLVGAGGIGIQLDSAVGALRWDNAVIIFFMILALVLLSEIISAYFRKKTI